MSMRIHIRIGYIKEGEGEGEGEEEEAGVELMCPENG